MVEQSKFSAATEHGLGSPENNMVNGEKRPPVTIRKTALRDMQNEQRNDMPTPIINSLFEKDKMCAADPGKTESGIKRPSGECIASPARNPSPSSGTANGHLVYVRRKLEGDVGKHEAGQSEGKSNIRTQMKEPNFSCFPAVAPLPGTLMSTSAKPSVPLHVGMSGVLLAPQGLSYDKMDWEERFDQLQMLLKRLDESDRKDHMQMLRSLSSVELSRHAVELEKRSIQLSLEEAKEVQRAAALNVLGKSMNNVKTPSPFTSS